MRGLIPQIIFLYPKLITVSATSKCKNPLSRDSPLFEGSTRKEDKRRIVRHILKSPDGVPLRNVVDGVFDLKESLPSDTSDPNYQLVRRTVNNADFLKTDKRNGLLQVEVSDDALPLETQLALAKKARRDGDDEKLSSDTAETDRKYAKDRVTDYFEDMTRVFSDKIRSWLLEELGTELRSIDDRYNLFQHRVTDETGLIPYRNRFNDVSRATNVLNGFEDALSRASDRYDVGTFVTLTVDPKRFDGHTEAIDALYDNKARLKNWLKYDGRLGYTPSNLAVLEFMDNGLPHIHLCLFGVEPSELPSQDELREYWDERRDVGSQVHKKRIHTRNGRFLLRDTDEGDASNRSLKNYLTDGMYDLIRVANSEPEDILEDARNGDATLWKQALYWYSERRYWSGSDALKKDNPDADPDEGDDELPYVSMWKYIGTFHANDIPNRVIRNMSASDTGDNDAEPPPDAENG